MQIDQIMNRKVVTVEEGDTLKKVSKIFFENSISGAPVLDSNDEVVGIISESDIVKAMKPFEDRLRMIYPSLSFMSVTFEKDVEEKTLSEVVKEVQDLTVGQVMVKEVLYLEPGDPIEKAVDIMNQRNVNRLPVISDGKLVGIVTRADILRCLATVDLSKL